jgi:hypothetical protein
MWQYVQVIGTKGVAVAGKFKESDIAKMGLFPKHPGHDHLD